MTDSVIQRGAEMFARYAYAPNALGYCGPPLGATLRDGSVDEVRRAATRFSGAWPYLRVLSRLTGIADPLDYRLVEFCNRLPANLKLRKRTLPSLSSTALGLTVPAGRTLLRRCSPGD